MFDIVVNIISVVFVLWLGLQFLRWVIPFLYRRDYSRYPVFSPEEIESELKQAEYYNAVDIKNRKDLDLLISKCKGNALLNSELSQEIRSKQKNILWNEVIAFHHKYLSQTKIESNVSVLNGNKIRKTRKNYYDNLKLDIKSAANKVYRAWETDKVGSSDWTKSFDGLFQD